MNHRFWIAVGDLMITASLYVMAFALATCAGVATNRTLGAPWPIAIGVAIACALILGSIIPTLRGKA